MKHSWVVSLLLLSFILHEVQGIRLEKGFMQDTKDQGDKKSLTERSVVLREAMLCNGDCSGTVKNKPVSRVSKKSSAGNSHHWLDEDYYGPRNHKPKHH